MSDDQELLDLVDENDQVIGSMYRKELYEKKLHNYRVVHAFLRNEKGQLWIPKRTSTKKIYPNALDYGVAGHVSSGETYDEALKKEASEELNLDLEHLEWKLLGKLVPPEAHCFQQVYEILFEGQPEFNHQDFIGGEWMYPSELVQLIKGGELAKTDIVTTVEKFYTGQN